MPAALERAVRKCMAKDPDARWQSTADFRDELQWISETAGDASIPPAPPPQRAIRNWLPAALAFALGVAGGILWHSSRTPEAAPAKYSRVTFRAGLHFTASAGQQSRRRKR